MTDHETHPAGTADLVEQLRGADKPLLSQAIPYRDVRDIIRQAADRIEQLEAENKRLGDLYDDTCYYHTPDGRAQFHARKIVALESELTRANAANDIWRKNSRETFEAMVAMRDSINEFVPMPSLESDLLQGPENSVFCATVAEAVIAELTRDNAATAAAYEMAAQIADDFVRMRERQIETEKSKSALHVDVPQIMRWQAGRVQSKAIAAAIRALATPDQTAALDKLIAEAVEEEVGRVTRIAASLFPGGYDRNHAAILAVSKKGGA